MNIPMNPTKWLADAQLHTVAAAAAAAAARVVDAAAYCSFDKDRRFILKF